MKPRAALRVENAILGKLLGTVKPDGSHDQEAINLVDLLVSDREGLGLADFKHAILSSAGQISALSATGKAGYDISPHLKTAVAQYVAWKADGAPGSFQSYLAQADLFRGELPLVVQNLAALAASGRLATALARYAELAAQQDSDNQGLFDFGDAATAKTPPADLLAQADRDTLPPSGSPVTSFTPAPSARELAPASAPAPAPKPVSGKPAPRPAPLTLPESGAWSYLRAPYDPANPPSPSAQDSSGHGLGIDNPPKTAHRNIFPHFMGNKREMADRTTQAVQKAMPLAERQRIHTIVDYFGGGGAWGLYHALENFPNAKRLIVNEFDPDRLGKIRLLHEIDGQVADIARRILEPRIDELAKEIDNTSSRSVIADHAEQMFKHLITDPTERAAFQAFLDCAMTQFSSVRDDNGNVLRNTRVGIEKILADLAEDGRNAKAAADEFKSRGGSIEYSTGDAEANGRFLPHGDGVMSIADPPYYRTASYQGGRILGLDRVPDNWSYTATRDFLKFLVDSGDGIIYTDEAWWHKPDYTPDRQGDLFNGGKSVFDRENEILLDIINSFDRFDNAGRVAGRQETLGIHHGTQQESENGQNGRSLLADSSADGRGIQGNQPSGQRMAAIPPGQNPALSAGGQRGRDGDGNANATRHSVTGLYTGSAADYANRDEQGNIVNPPSLHHVGTGEGAQVYGWGLYASNKRGVAEGYAAKDKRSKPYFKPEGKKGSLEIAAGSRLLAAYDGIKNAPFRPFSAPDPSMEEILARAISYVKWDVGNSRLPPKTIQFFKETLEELEKHGMEYIPAQEHLYEQTFFTDRAPGDESHLLNWYEPVTKEQREWIMAQAGKEGLDADELQIFWSGRDKAIKEKGFDAGLRLGVGRITSSELYHNLEKALGTPKAASEFLARAGIDGVKYPVDSYGKTAKDGDKAGWNYVSFRDDNIRVDHKWTDGKQRFSMVRASEFGRGIWSARAGWAAYDNRYPQAAWAAYFGVTMRSKLGQFMSVVYGLDPDGEELEWHHYGYNYKEHYVLRRPGGPLGELMDFAIINWRDDESAENLVYNRLKELSEKEEYLAPVGLRYELPEGFESEKAFILQAFKRTKERSFDAAAAKARFDEAMRKITEDGLHSRAGEKRFEIVGREESLSFAARIQEWMSEQNIAKAKGKTREEIFKEFGNELQPIAHIPLGYLPILDGEITDPRVYSGKGYFIDHAVNHHPEVSPEEYANIQQIIDNADDVKLDDRNPNRNKSLLFIKEVSPVGAVVVSFDKGANGKIVLHKSFFNKMKKGRFDKYQSVKLPPEDGSSSISPAAETAAAGRLPALESASTLPNSLAEVKSESAQTASQGLPGETRAEVKRRPTPGMSRSDVLSAFFAQQLLAGKKVKPEEVANLVRAMGITDRTAAEISAAAQELAGKNRQSLSAAAANHDPALLETLARQALDERYRKALDNALVTGARSSSPSIARRVERAIHENRARQLRTARGYAAAEMMGEFGLPLAFAVHQAALVASTEANTPADFREAARAVEEEIARLDDPAAPAISPETAAKLEALRKHLEHARAVLAIRKGESPDIDESTAPAIEQAAAALADPAMFATALVEWTARKIRERYPDIAADNADIWKNPVAVKTVRETAVSFLRSFATSLLGQPKNNYLRNNIDHYINTLETATTYNQIAKGTERIYAHILSAVRAIHKHFNLKDAAAERHRQLMDERLRRRRSIPARRSRIAPAKLLELSRPDFPRPGLFRLRYPCRFQGIRPLQPCATPHRSKAPLSLLPESRLDFRW